MSGISFGKAKLSDALQLYVLLQTVYMHTYAIEGITSEFANFTNDRFSVKAIEKAIEENHEQFIVSYYNENPIGAAQVIYKSECPIRKITVSELSKLYVLNRFHGKGVGFDLIRETEKELKSKGYGELTLEVYTRNEKAIKFYKKQGYTILGKIDFPMETNTYENYVMNKLLD